ncbi:hypothetical protein [Neolewinella agarilytica]|uniref:Uncharacterized protein n=1 Tax=Neolewinella agarilytica TaxID=478744 RepID=A0A1H9DT11_9BACT|nr:hypothetical protein [Neolewinella agarilytica]SEQ16609.1 hypothetical protein SAMN05444359_106122 [Neolewinella agarilytica]
MDSATGAILFTSFFILLPLVFLLVYYLNRNKKVDTTQREISDRDLLHLLHNHPGGLLTAKEIAEKAGLTMAQTRSRLSFFAEQLIVRRGSNGLAYYYELYAPIEDVGQLELSPEPFLTVADLQKIFRAYDYRVSPIDLIAATGLPWRILAREMKHFKKKGVIDILRIARPGDSYRQYVLKEPYIDLPESSNEAMALDLEMKEILLDENLLV